jgi:hypothetical protein
LGELNSFAQSFSPLQQLNPALTGSNINWNYNMGYRFEVSADGDITALGGKWTTGITHTVRLFAYPAGTQLASINVTGDGNWKYANLGTAVSVTQGSQYVVAVRLNSQSSGQYSNTVNFPYSYGGIEILGTAFLRASNAMPTNLNLTNSYGQADVIFQPCAYAGSLSANKTSVIPGGSATLTVSNFTGSIKWQESTVI